MSPIDKSLLKLIKLDKSMNEIEEQWMTEYLPYYSNEQKQKYIKIFRGKLREIERREKRIIGFLSLS